MSQAMKTPGPDHPITIAPAAGRLRVEAGGERIADTADALILREAAYPPVSYIPRADVDMTKLRRSDRTTFCPYKGPCSYFSIPAAGAAGDNAVWSYEQPFAAVAAIKDALAFYPDRVDLIAESKVGLPTLL